MGKQLDIRAAVTKEVTGPKLKGIPEAVGETSRPIRVTFQVDEEFSEWLKAAAFWTGQTATDIFKGAVTKELKALEAKRGRPFERRPGRG